MTETFSDVRIHHFQSRGSVLLCISISSLYLIAIGKPEVLLSAKLMSFDSILPKEPQTHDTLQF